MNLVKYKCSSQMAENMDQQNRIHKYFSYIEQINIFNNFLKWGCPDSFAL